MPSCGNSGLMSWTTAGRISRRKLSGIVWNNPERLDKLSSLVHPPVSAIARKGRWPKSHTPIRRHRSCGSGNSGRNW